MFAALGAVEQIFFRGVGPGGYDIYGVRFAKGSAEIRLLLVQMAGRWIPSSAPTATTNPAGGGLQP